MLLTENFTPLGRYYEQYGKHFDVMINNHGNSYTLKLGPSKGLKAPAGSPCLRGTCWTQTREAQSYMPLIN